MIKLFKTPDRAFYCISYAVFALPLIVFYAYFIPAFQVPDESSHFARAYQLTHGEFFPTKQQMPDASGEYTVGGTVDPGIFTAAGLYTYLQRNSETKLKPKRVAQANSITWQGGQMRDTRNVAVYAPTFYAVPALGVMLGQYFDMSIVESLTLSRLMSGLFALLIICIAMLTLQRGFGVFFVVLLMPMTVAQIASASPDATCFAAAAFCVALMSRLNPDVPQRTRRLYLIFSVLLMIMIACARPPYAALSLFYLYFAFSFRAKISFVIECCTAFFAVLLATTLWALYVALYVSVPFGLEGTDYAEQALLVLQSPLDWLGVLGESWRRSWDFYLYSFMGIVGHLDTGFPDFFYFFTALIFCLALFMSYMPEKGAFFKAIREQALLPIGIVLVTIVGMFLVLYISWSPVNYPIVEGVQGRYFIPAALFLALGAANKALTDYSLMAYRCMMLAFAMCTLIITPYVVLARYY